MKHFTLLAMIFLLATGGLLPQLLTAQTVERAPIGETDAVGMDRNDFIELDGSLELIVKCLHELNKVKPWLREIESDVVGHLLKEELYSFTLADLKVRETSQGPSDYSDYRRMLAVEVLGLRQDVNAVDDLITILNSHYESTFMKASAARALGRIGDEKAIPHLKIFGRPTVAFTPVKKASIIALARIGSIEAGRLIRQTLIYENNEDAIQTCLVALSLLRDPYYISDFLKVFANERLSDLSRQFAISALGLMPKESLKQYDVEGNMLIYLERSNENIRGSIYVALSRIGGNTTIKRLKAYQDTNFEKSVETEFPMLICLYELTENNDWLETAKAKYLNDKTPAPVVAAALELLVIIPQRALYPQIKEYVKPEAFNQTVNMTVNDLAAGALIRLGLGEEEIRNLGYQGNFY